MSSRRLTAVLSITALGVAARASAAEPAPASTDAAVIRGTASDPSVPAAAGETAIEQKVPLAAGAAASAAAGAFLPFTAPVSSNPTYANALSGYDGARQVVVYEAVANAHVVGGLSLRAGFASHDLSGNASVLFGGRFQFLSQQRQGLDLGVGAFYLPQDIDGEGQIKASLLVGRNFGRVALFSALSYGQDPEGDDHRVEFSAGMLVPVAPAVFAGLDARLRALVFSSDEKHNGVSEPVIDVTAGPLAHYVLGTVVLTAQAGLSALAVEGPHGSARPTREIRYGALGLFAVGLSL